LGFARRPAPLASTSVPRLHHHAPSPTPQSDLDASSSASLVDRPLSTRGGDFRTRARPSANSRRCKARWEQGGRALRDWESRCVLVLPASSPSLPSAPSPRARQIAERLRRRDDELTRAPRAQGSHAGRVDGPVERRRCWRLTSSGSSRSLYVPLALSGHATGSSEHSCASVSCALTSSIVRAGQSRPRWHPLLFLVSKARLLARQLHHDRAGRCVLCLSRKQSGPGCRKMSVSSSLLVPAAARAEPSRTGPYEAAPALTCP